MAELTAGVVPVENDQAPVSSQAAAFYVRFDLVSGVLIFVSCNISAMNPSESAMGKLRHIAIQVPDLEKAAAFYEGVFGLKRLKKVDAPIGNAISLSDGVMNLTLLHFPEGTNGGKHQPART